MIVAQEMTPEVSLTLLEEEVRRFWRRYSVSETFQARHRDGALQTLALEPLMAAGRPRGEWVALLATADLIGRYQAMRGWPVRRRAGWICHGLPIELAVERSLEPDLTGYDVPAFGAACREAAIEGVRDGEVLSERLAVWSEADDRFVSLEPNAVDAVWGVLRRVWDAGRLKRERRVIPVCPRCATPLSSSEAGRRAAKAEMRSAWIRLPWDGEADTYLLVSTSVPWSLVGMVAVAAHTDAEYVLVEVPARVAAAPGEPPARSDRLLLAEAALKRTSLGDYRIVQRMHGRSLRSTRYHPPFTFLAAGSGAGRVLISEEVPLDQGTGLWPVTPAFDAVSLALAEQHGLPVPELLDDWGAFDDAVAHWRGLSPLDAEPLLLEDLQARGLLFDERSRDSQRALCPHCATALLPLARSVWTVEVPGEPWVVSRDRVWGVPLPVWECAQCDHSVCVEGLDDLAQRAAIDVAKIDPHRPAVDRLVLRCEKCGGTMRRVAPVLDASLESAVLSITSLPEEGAGLAIGVGDEGQGWLDDCAKVAALLDSGPAWERALTLSENEADLAQDQERYAPGDALRWATYAGTTLGQAERDFLRPLWRLVVSLLDPSEAGSMPPGQATGELLDEWMAARLYHAAAAVTRALDEREPGRAARELAALLDDWAGWYAPRRPGVGRELVEPLTLLLAPFAPHLAEAIHRQRGRRSRPSVHLEDWPVLNPAWENESLLKNMTRIQHLAALGLRARAQAGMQPDELLPGALVGSLAGATWSRADLEPFTALLADSLGVARVELSADAAGRVEWRLSLDPERPVQRDVSQPAIAAALAALSADRAAQIAAQLQQGISVGLEVSDQAITLLPDEVTISVRPRAGWAAAADDEHLVALVVG